MEQRSTAILPSISVVIPTYNRPEDLRRSLESLRQVDYPTWDVLVVDQSDNSLTRAVVLSFAGEAPHLSYRHLSLPSASNARNIGLESARYDVIAFLDDDCLPRPDWLTHLGTAALRYPDAGVIFGSVVAAPHDWRTHFVPVYVVPRERIWRGTRSVLRTGGILQGMGANMTVRRSAYDRIGPFDLRLGPGSQNYDGFPVGGDDTDYSYRCLKAGLAVAETPRAVVQHHGMRAFEGGEASRLLRGYSYAVGGMYMKWVRAGDPVALLALLIQVLSFICNINIVNVVLGRRPNNIGRVLVFFKGMVDSFKLSVDRGRCLYGLPRLADEVKETRGAPEDIPDVGTVLAPQMDA